MKKLNLQLLKTFFSDINIKKKILSSTCYYKYIIRQNLNKKRKIYLLIDNDITFFNSTKVSTKWEIAFKKKFLIGISTNLNNFIFKNRYNKNISFKSPFLTRSHLFNSAIEKVKSTLFIKEKTRFLINRPLKGGYVVYSKGISGFLPRTELKNILEDDIFIKDFQKSFNKVYLNFLKEPLTSQVFNLNWLEGKIANAKIFLKRIRKKSKNKQLLLLTFIFFCEKKE